MSPGRYDFVISYIGFESFRRKILTGTLNEVLDLGNILMAPVSRELSKVNVVGQKQVVSSALDKKSYSTESFISASGDSALTII